MQELERQEHCDRGEGLMTKSMGTRKQITSRVVERKERAKKILREEGTCTIAYLHHALKRKEDKLTRPTVDQMIRQMNDIITYKVRDVGEVGGRRRTVVRTVCKMA